MIVVIKVTNNVIGYNYLFILSFYTYSNISPLRDLRYYLLSTLLHFAKYINVFKEVKF